MKKLLRNIGCSICIIALCISMGILSTQAVDNIHVQLDGKELSFDVPPQIINDRTMVPMRTIFEALGYNVKWNGEEQTIYAIRHPQYIMMSIDTTKYFDSILFDMTDHPSLADILPETAKELEVPPQIVDGRTLVPLRAVSEMSGCDVQWDAQNSTVIISTEKYQNTSTYAENPTSYKIKLGEGASKYEDISANINQIQSFINRGLYLEAIRDCEQTKAWHTLSPEDIGLLDELKVGAQNKYDEYVAEQKKWKEYYYEDWGIGFTGLASYRPTYFDNSDSIRVYSSSNASNLTINSYKVATSGYYADQSSPSAIVSSWVKLMKILAYQGEYANQYFEVLSESDTTVGNFSARQATIRLTIDANRYGTKKHYTIQRCTAFQYGDWIYTIVGMQDEYEWTNNFYNLMDKVRTSITFY